MWSTDSWLSPKFFQVLAKPVNPRGNQPWIFTGTIDAKAEAPMLWPPDVKNWLIGKHPQAGKDWGQEEKGVIEDKMVGWHHQPNGHGLSKLQEIVKDRETWHAAVQVTTKSWTWLSDWTTMTTGKTKASAIKLMQGYLFVCVCVVELCTDIAQTMMGKPIAHLTPVEQWHQIEKLLYSSLPYTYKT